MILNGFLAFAVVIIACLFLYVSFRLKRDADKVVSYTGKYLIEMNADFANRNISVYLNDSLIINGIMPDSVIQTTINKFADETMLMIVDNASDIATSFNLNPDGSRVTVKNTAGIISIIESNEMAF